MPYYDYECECGFKEMNRKEHPDTLCCECPKCKGMMRRMLPTKVYINMGPCKAYGYYDENLESYVSTNRQRKELMRQKGVTEKGATPKNEGAWV